jgi:SAM-dependent methyltransferase
MPKPEAAGAPSRAITPDDVRWHGADAVDVALRCAVCGHAGPHRPVLDVPSLAAPHPWLTFVRCAGCGSGFYHPPGVHDFSDLGGLDDSFTRLYAEVGGGVWETIWPLLVASERGSLLDIGCGYGFALDFWQQSGRGDAVGVELAEYGAAGAQALGVTIHDELLQDCEALRGRRYDCVYASEVIEHVPSPADFAALLAEWVSEEGVLTLTTPSAEFIVPEQHGTTQLVALAPGFHGFLLSAPAFEQALRDAGFAHVEVRRFHERQMAWASRRPLRLDFDHARMRAAYLDYLRARTRTLPAASSIGLGYGYRLMRDETNAGALERAREAELRLREGQ